MPLNPISVSQTNDCSPQRVTNKLAIDVWSQSVRSDINMAYIPIQYQQYPN